MGSAAGPDRGSFRDPGGFVFTHEGRVRRQINQAFADRWDAFASSGLLEDLQANRLLIGHETLGLDEAFSPSNAYAVIEPEQIELVSYPYEWSFQELKDAALLTLEAQTVASRKGQALRDASAYNVQFHRGRPILIDTLSFEEDVPERPWIGYRQFSEHFLAPLAMMAYRDVRCGLMLREFIDGIPVDLASTLLPGRTKLNLGLASHIHAHAGAHRRHVSSSGRSPRPLPRTSPFRKAALIDNLRRTIEALAWTPGGTPWADYADNTSYAAQAAASKDELVRRYLQAAGGRVVWDLGANVGRFSAIAAELGRQVIAWDIDPAATDLHYREVRRTGQSSVLPLLGDLANPSPGLGWANAERRSLFERANADVVLALALVHHLAIGRNIRLSMIADVFARLAPQLIVEFIPESDPMVQQLIGNRDDVLPYLSIQGFRDVFAARFDVIDDTPISSSGRRLLRMARRSVPT
jgi:SAM-dependent methyltransferase